MNKSLTTISIAIIIIVIGVAIVIIFTNNAKKFVDQGVPKDLQTNKIKNPLGKTLVVYYSATGTTKKLALEIAKDLKADTFEIKTETNYTSEDLDWTNKNSKVSKEYNDKTLRNNKLIKDTPDNWDSYETVFIGYPIWWDIAAWPAETFVKKNNFLNKNVIPFCTAITSSIGESSQMLSEQANGGNWENGQCFYPTSDSAEVKVWLDSLE